MNELFPFQFVIQTRLWHLPTYTFLHSLGWKLIYFFCMGTEIIKHIWKSIYCVISKDAPVHSPAQHLPNIRISTNVAPCKRWWLNTTDTHCEAPNILPTRSCSLWFWHVQPAPSEGFVYNYQSNLMEQRPCVELNLLKKYFPWRF